ncbi:DUF4387 domain-containing protein [Thermovenabulum gondwanense]|uniref:DUF4387 domain-containing protein n=1 Tax=Thermovenabulum gondwanense TaxID=520767 RepID=A0A162MRD3_9FIRM|nr:DUF4387 domain-containing protein [Thermovenabulum gondwanense]KYO66992.1 hypothetical protein ATZ99_08090 [Thermovenabulum gondwanense]
MKKVYLKDIAKVLRSKNSGPFEMTLDIIFKNKEDYEKIKGLGIINEDLISRIYNIDREKIITFVYFDAANAIKITIPRLRPQGTVGETDMHAAQQHIPLMFVEVPWE